MGALDDLLSGSNQLKPSQQAAQEQKGSSSSALDSLLQTNGGKIAQQPHPTQQPQSQNWFQNAVDAVTSTVSSKLKELFPQAPQTNPIQLPKISQDSVNKAEQGSMPSPTPNTPSTQPNFDTNQPAASAQFSQPLQKAPNLIDLGITTAQNAIYQSALKVDQGNANTQDNIVNSIAKPLAFVQKNIIEPVTQNPVVAPFNKGFTETWLGGSNQIMNTLNKSVPQSNNPIIQGYNTVGELGGQILAYIAGGEIVDGLNFGKAALPVLFTTLGQTSASADTTITQRIEEAPVDAIAGWLFSKVPAAKKLISPEGLKQMGIVIGVNSGQGFINSLIKGLSPKDAAIATAKMAVIAGVLHVSGSIPGLAISRLKGNSEGNNGMELTPQQARVQAEATDLNGTHAAEVLKQAADHAEAIGKNLMITAGEEQKLLPAPKTNPNAGEGFTVSNKADKTAIDVTKTQTAYKAALDDYNSKPTPAKLQKVQDLRQAMIDAKATFTAKTDKGTSFKVDFVEPTKITQLDENGKPVSQLEQVSQPDLSQAQTTDNQPQNTGPTQKGLSQEEAIQYIKDNNDHAKQDYFNRIKQEYGSDNVITADEGKYVIPGYDGHNAPEYHEAASQLAKQIYDEKLISEKGKGNNTVLFTAGGTGVGKTTGLRMGGEDLGKYSIVYDTNLTGESAISKVQKALDNGYKVKIDFVQRDPHVSFEKGVLPRVRSRNRIVTLSEHMTRHAEALQSVVNLKEKFGDKIDVGFLDNTSHNVQEAKFVSFDNLPKYEYTSDRTIYEQHIKNAIEANKNDPTKGITQQEANAILENKSGHNGSVASRQPETQRNEGTTGKPQEVKGSTASKIATSIESKAIEDKLTKGFEGVAGYDKITIKEQAEKAAELFSNIDQARRVIKGEEELPKGLKGTAVITAAEEYIKKTGDAQMAYDLANSHLVSETSAAAQELRLAAEREPDSLAKQLQDLKKVREDAVTKRTGKTRDKAIKDMTEQIKTEVKKVAPKKQDWAGFISSIQC